MLTEVKLCVMSYFAAIVVNQLIPINLSLFSFNFENLELITLLPILLKFLEISLLLLLNQNLRWAVFTAYWLGCVFLTGIKFSNIPFGLYLSILSFFHFSEYVTTGLSNPQNLSYDSFLVNHSWQYGLAMLVSWLEYFAQLWLFPDIKHSILVVTYVGLAVCLAGEVIRKMAMLQAGRNFNHIVQSNKADEHKLVTNGVYSVCRHPSYVGWFLWSLGSQVVLVNPLCLIIYGVVSFAFFKERIYVEEYTLIAFFGDQYRDYQKTVGTGIPGIDGFHGPVVWGEKRD